MYGGNRRRVVAPSRAQWEVVDNSPLQEPSATFTRRVEMIYNTQFMIPGVPESMRRRNDILMELWQDQWPVLENFIETLDPLVQGAGEIRIYLRDRNDNLDLVENGVARRANKGNYFTLTGNWRQDVMLQLAEKLTAFTDNYQDYDSDDRYISAIRVFVDIGAGRGGAGRSLPSVFPNFGNEFVVYNPEGKTNCLAKCLVKAKIPTLGLIDNEPYVEAFEKITRVHPSVSLRLFSVTGIIMYRKDGDLFEFESRPNQSNQPAAWQHQSKCKYLILESGHYYLIQNVARFFQVLKDSLVCHGCCLLFPTKLEWTTHICRDPKCCTGCQMLFISDAHKKSHQNGDLLKISSKQCPSCKKVLFSTDCRDYHLEHCVRRKQIKVRENHDKFIKGKRKCLGCDRWHKPDHACYMKPNEIPKELKIKSWWAFDYESMLIYDKKIAEHKHFVNLVCVQKMFEEPVVRKTFKDLEEFFFWLYEEIVSDELVGFIAHNLKGYDGRLTLTKMFQIQSLDDQFGMIEEMVWEGAKIQTFKWKNIIFRDSLLHIAQPLANFPAIFDLKEMHKGHFPYIFNTPENQRYVGPIPHIKYFEPNLKSVKGRKDLLEWYENQKDVVYDFQQELEKYCISDVDILAKSLEKYNIAGQVLNHPMLPPLEKLTTASYTLNCWKTLHFPENKIVMHTFNQEKHAREALRGGRTDVRCFYRKWSLEDVFVKKKYGKYVDVQSMYPAVMFSQPLPCGKPKKKNDCTVEDLKNSFGFACVDISPPIRYVHHPVLVHRYNNKLVGHLKRWEQTTFTTVEVLDALEQGWILEKIYWIMDYEKDSDMFKDYIRKLIREKLHASDNSKEDLDQLQKEWMERFGVELDKTKMVYNAGVRTIAKTQINSLWGKLAECAKLEFSQNVNAMDFLALEAKERIGAISFKLKFRTGPDSWFVSGEEKNNHGYTDLKLAANRKKTNVAIGSFVTMWGRRMLWQEMERLGKRVLYHDTDSIIYEYDESKYNTPLGKCLGDWSDELKGRPMVEFVALAPKTYAYRYLDKPVDIPEVMDDAWNAKYQPYEIWEGKVYPIKEEIKVKGFKLHYDAKKCINFDGLLALLVEDKVKLSAKQMQFKYNQEKGIITSFQMVKDLVFDYEKGVRGEDNLSYPYGVEQYWDNGVAEEGVSMRRRSLGEE